MLKILPGLFFILHGLVHLLSIGQSRRFFEIKPGMVWPDGSWVFSKLFTDGTSRMPASIACLLASTGFVAGGIGLLAGYDWWAPVVGGSAIFSSLVTLLFGMGENRIWTVRGPSAC